jgi:dihydroflavonol-4-reductase
MNTTESRALVMGASGFLGSHVVRGLVRDGRKVRIYCRATSNTSAIDHLGCEKHIGEITDAAAIEKAMQGCDVIYYCIVDPRAWLKDPAPLAEININAFKLVMDIALKMQIRRFIYTSTFMTIGINDTGIFSEKDEFNWWDDASEYARVRVTAEKMFFDYCKRGLPGIACNATYTYGAEDLLPTGQGWMVRLVVEGLMPCNWDVNMPSVGIQDAADGMILAEKNGRIGERYILNDRTYTFPELNALIARAVGRRPPLFKMPRWIMWSACWINEKVFWLLGKETEVSLSSWKLMCIPDRYDSSKARNELGWNPRPVEESIKEGALWFKQHPAGKK